MAASLGILLFTAAGQRRLSRSDTAASAAPLTTDICTHAGIRRYGPTSGDVAAVIRAGSLFCKGVPPHATWTCKNSNTGR
jgi:hypothetical protein